MAMKIALIGTGAVGWMRMLLRDLLAVPEFAGMRYALTVGAICEPEAVWQMTDEMRVAQAQWLPQYADEIPRAHERLAAHDRNGTRVKLRKTDGAARLKTKTIDEMAAAKSETRAMAGQTDRGTIIVKGRGAKPMKGKAPRVGLEPTTIPLTAGCSTIELSRKMSLLARRARVRRIFSPGGKSRRPR